MKIPWIFLLRRSLTVLPVLFGVSLVAFGILHLLPGDPVLMLVGERASEETMVKMREKMGLDRSVIYRFGIYLNNLIHLDLGKSLVSGEPVLNELLKRLPATLYLALASIILATFLGVLMGMLSALNAGRLTDFALTAIALFGISMPVFWVGLVLILVLAEILGWFPPSTEAVSLKYMILPVLTLSMRSASYIARITRSSVLDVLDQDYVRTAYAKGLSPTLVVWKHIFFNALIPIITVVGLDFASYLNGSVITETIFNWPGIGSFTMDAILKRDYPVVQGMVLMGAAIFVTMNILVDLLYGICDPKIRDDYLQGRF